MMMKYLILFFSLFATAFTPFAYTEPLSTDEEDVEPVSVVVLGSGIGALTSSLYLARGGLHPLVIAGTTPGGLLTQTHTVQNWPGELEIDGTALTDKVRIQAETNGARFVNEEVIGVDFSKRPFTIKTRLLDGEDRVLERHANAVIIAMGTQPNFLGVPGETGANGYWGRGVTNCAICDGALYRNKVVGVVGGGDAAVLEALYLSNLAKKVFVFVRKESLRAKELQRVQTLQSKSNIEVFYNTSIEKIQGDGKQLTSVLLKIGQKELVSFPLNGLFLAIGSRPNTELLQGTLQLDDRGYILLTHGQQTSVEGVFALGDIVDPIYKQAISAAGDGAKAALCAQEYVDRIGAFQNAHNVALHNNKAPSTHKVAPEVMEVRNAEQFKRELQESDIPVVVDFYASWCGPCKRLSPILESSAHQLFGKVKFLKVNVDQCSDLSATYDIHSMPTLLFFDHSGEVVDRKVGTDQISDFLQHLKVAQ